MCAWERTGASKASKEKKKLHDSFGRLLVFHNRATTKRKRHSKFMRVKISLQSSVVRIGPVYCCLSLKARWHLLSIWR